MILTVNEKTSLRTSGETIVEDISSMSNASSPYVVVKRQCMRSTNAPYKTLNLLVAYRCLSYLLLILCVDVTHLPCFGIAHIGA